MVRANVLPVGRGAARRDGMAFLSNQPGWLDTVRPHLCSDEVHVWIAELDGQAEGKREDWSALSPEELARARRFHTARDRARYVAARGILRTILGGYPGVAAGRLEFLTNAYGKLRLASGGGGEGIRFNVSHSEGVALIAVTLGREVGVDVEPVRPILDAEEMARLYLPAEEAQSLQAVGPEELSRAFLEAWCRQEAKLKARGLGWSVPEEAGGNGAEAGRSTTVWTDGMGVQTFEPRPGMVAAVAAEGRDWKLRVIL